MVEGVTLDWETVDRIVLAGLKDQKSYLQKELDEWQEGKWLHLEDVAQNHILIDAMDKIIKYYGG